MQKRTNSRILTCMVGMKRWSLFCDSIEPSFFSFFLCPHRINGSGGPPKSLLSGTTCPHHGPGPLLPPLCPHSYTAQLPPLDPPEATTSVVRLNQFKPPMQWRGYKPTTLSSEGICAYTQPLLVERQLIHAIMGI